MEGPPEHARQRPKGRRQQSAGQSVKKQVKMDQDVTDEDDITTGLGQLHLEADHITEGTALCYDDRMTEPRCTWDSQFPERPERVIVTMQKIQEYGLLSRCKPIESRYATREELMLIHSADYVDLISSTQKMGADALKTMAANYDMVFLHEKTYPSCCLAVGCVLQVVDHVMQGQVRNGLAVVRPPGHNALTDTANGYCIFNNLAIAARYAQKHHDVERVMIVDWDVHHGQGTQYIFEEDSSVLCFSIHRYEHGDFWPNLPESDCTAVGTSKGLGFNINIPWNKTGMSDADYIAAFHNVLLPVAHEFRPQLILVAAGFSSVVGDPQGNMLTTPSCFTHLTHMLLPFAKGRVILALEGGYNLRSTAESTCACLKALLGDHCPLLELPYITRLSALESISSVITVQRKFWNSLRGHETGNVRDDAMVQKPRPRVVDVDRVLDRSMKEVMRRVAPHRTGLVYDEQMKEHSNLWEMDHPEQPQRIVEIYVRHQEMKLVERCQSIPTRLATEGELERCHSSLYIKDLKQSQDMKPRDLQRMSAEYNSIYICPSTYASSLMAVGSTLCLVEAVLTSQVQNGVAIVRPPGHHAEKDFACGFCFFNNVALAARHAQSMFSKTIRVLILDWDVHHGNGTQHMFEDDPSVLYISIHRYDNGNFFPNSEDADYERVGDGPGEGFNVNIPWNGSRMGDPEYMAAFHTIVMPISCQFQPNLVLVSAGFDAARGDPLGGCKVSPECYAHMTHMLMSLAGGRLVMVLEGGYNLMSISECMTICTKTLLGDTPPYLDPLAQPLPSAMLTINKVITTQRKYWSCLRLLIPEIDSQTKVMKLQKVSMWPQPNATPEPTARRGSIWIQPDASSQGRPLDSVSLYSEGTIDDSVPKGESTVETQQSQGPSTVSLLSSMTQEQETDSEAHGRKTSMWPQGAPPPYLSMTTDLEGIGSSRHRRTSLWPQMSSEAEVVQHPSRRFSLRQTPDSSTDRESPASDSKPRGKGKASFSYRTPSIRTDSDGGKSRWSEPKDSDASLSESSGGRSESEDEESCRRKGRCPQPSEPLYTQTSGPGMVYTVVPLTSCPQLRAVSPVPSHGLDVLQGCEECGAEGENWVCLSCYQVYCGRYVNSHMETHWANSGHPIALSYADLSTWCYGCDAYIHHEVLSPVKEEVHRLKFGQEMPS